MMVAGDEEEDGMRSKMRRRGGVRIREDQIAPSGQLLLSRAQDRLKARIHVRPKSEDVERMIKRKWCREKVGVGAESGPRR